MCIYGHPYLQMSIISKWLFSHTVHESFLQKFCLFYIQNLSHGLFFEGVMLGQIKTFFSFFLDSHGYHRST